MGFSWQGTPWQGTQWCRLRIKLLASLKGRDRQIKFCLRVTLPLPNCQMSRQYPARPCSKIYITNFKSKYFGWLSSLLYCVAPCILHESNIFVILKGLANSYQFWFSFIYLVKAFTFYRKSFSVLKRPVRCRERGLKLKIWLYFEKICLSCVTHCT